MTIVLVSKENTPLATADATDTRKMVRVTDVRLWLDTF